MIRNTIKAEGKGLTKAQYEKVSQRKKLPHRCPLIYECKRAEGTHWLLKRPRQRSFTSYIFDVSKRSGCAVDFENLSELDNETNPFMRTINENDKPKESLIEIDNACPEVVFDKFNVFASWYKKYESDSGSKYYHGLKGKHFGECPEFLKWCMERKIPFSHAGSKERYFAEKILQSYLIGNLEILEKGLKFKEELKFVPTGQIDIVAEDVQGNNVILELKARPLTRDAIHKLVGQVSGYYNEQKSNSSGTRLFIVIPKDMRKKTYTLYQGLKHWIDNIRIFEFDNSKGKYIFEEIAF